MQVPSRDNHAGGKKRILIAEDHTILREGLRALLASQSEFDVVGEADDGRETIRQVGKLQPDVVLLDLSMPRMSGMEAIGEIKKANKATKILVLTVHNEEEYLVAALRAGADGYCLKDASRSELLLAISSVIEGKTYLSPDISGNVVRGYLASGGKIPKLETSWDILTKREREVLKLVAEGFRNKEIADYLFISVKTVEKHRANLMKKLELRNAAELAAYARIRGLVL
jgi:two-component system response regulator NreC